MEEKTNVETNESPSYEFNSDLDSLVGLFTESNVLTVRPETVKKWLKHPMAHNKQLRDLSRKLYNSNGIYTNVVDYMVALPTLDRVVWSSNSKHSRYKKNKESFLKALKNIKDKITTRDNLFKSAIDGTAFYYFEVSESTPLPSTLSDADIEKITDINANFNCSLISLPTDYCRIIGQKNSSYVVAFDMSYFDKYISNGLALKLKRYPKEVRQKYKKYRKDRNQRWAVLDNDKTVTTKIRANIDEPWGRPVGLAGFVDMIYDEYFIETKRHILDEVNSTIIYQTFPEGEKKGTSSLTQKQQKNQHDNIKNALFSRGHVKGTNFFSVASGTKLDKIQTNIEFLKAKGEDELIKRITTNLGFAGSALNGQDGNHSSQKLNVDMISSEINSWLEQIQDELNKVINKNIIKDNQVYMEVYYLPTTQVNKKEQVSFYKDLYTNGGGSIQMWIASTGVNPEVYISLMEYEREQNFAEKFPPHQTSYTLTDKEPGRKEEDNPTNPNTIKSKTNGSNNNPD